MAHSPTDFLKTASRTAEHYGFKTAEQLRKSPECVDCTVTLPQTFDQTTHLDQASSRVLDNVRSFCEEKLHALRAPVLLYNHHHTHDTDEVAVSFSIFNVEKSIAEAILIQASRALLTDLGHPEHLVRINSLGDNESLTRYSREIGNFLRRRLDTMPADARELMKEHPLRALAHLVEVGHDLGYRSPNPLEYLSDQSRKHFREIVEYLDMSDTPYEIDPKMLGTHDCCNDALFTIETLSTTPSTLSVRGGRFNELMYRTTKSRTPASAAVITLTGASLPARIPRPREQSPAVYVVQLGFGPKVRSLMLIDRLRAADIPVFHDLTSDSLSAQLRDAEARGVRYTIIVGQKEFVEGSVILRDMNARNQEHVPLDALVKKLKRHVTVGA